MNADKIYLIFIALLIIEQVIELALNILNIRQARREAPNMPDVLMNLYDGEAKKKSLEYTCAKCYFAIFSNLYSFALIILLLVGGIFPALNLWLENFNLLPIWQGVFFLLLISLIFSMSSVPLSYYSSFILEEKFGFNKSTKKLWLKDQVMGLLLSITISLPIIYLLLYFMSFLSVYWWLYAAGLIICAQVFLAFIYPVWIAPLFNKFVELEEGELKNEILKLVESVGYKSTGVYKIDGSKRSKHANAYFAGLGSSKRIVLFDTLISIMQPKEILAVLAHEIGHEKLGHIKKSLVFSALTVLVAFYLIATMYESESFYHAFGFAEPSNHAALLIFSLLAGPVMYFVSPLFNGLSRRFEYQADRFAIRAVGDYKPLASALAALSKNSLSNLNPHPAYSFMHYSHPTLSERIRAMS